MALPRCSVSEKVCFSKKDAQAKCNQLYKKLGKRETRCYPCPDCNWWHISTVKNWMTIIRKKGERPKKQKFNKNKALQNILSD